MSKINKAKFENVAIYLQENIKDESDAIKNYQEFYNIVRRMENDPYMYQTYDSNTDSYLDTPTKDADKKLCKIMMKTIEEYIQEEMKHLDGLNKLYKIVTGFKAEGDKDK